MAVIFTAHNETSLAEWTATSGADISWSAAAALAQSAGGIAILIDDTTADHATKSGLNNTSNKSRFRFYITPNGLVIATGTLTGICAIANTAADVLAFVRLEDSSDNHLLSVRMYNDADAGSTIRYSGTISESSHWVEVYAQRAATNVSADGSLAWWLDGVAMTSITGVDNYDRWAQVDMIRTGCGIVSAVPAGMSGTFYLDEFVLNDDGGAIGPVAMSNRGGLAFGEQNPTAGEGQVPWPTWDNGAAGAITVSGDANWGKMELDIGEEGRSAIYDLGDANPRTYTLTLNRYGTGSGTSTLQIRGQAAVFVQDDNVLAWTTYTVPTLQSWRYVQVREIKSS